MFFQMNLAVVVKHYKLSQVLMQCNLLVCNFHQTSLGLPVEYTVDLWPQRLAKLLKDSISPIITRANRQTKDQLI